ncbi:putative murein peptide carboxypeptidase [bioreactor metagenome]|uniref:Putative murein peptide carboxypeptidase n=1 Tax=bioreactor metagenome TaxID=1076179 RepID=A0A645E5L9_9ZZZZ
MEKFGAGRPVAGPMLGKLAECAASPWSMEFHRRAFRPEAYEIEAAPEYGPVAELKAGSAAGLPLAGNLSVAASLCGTPYFPDVSGRILILEDLNEPVYRLDRCLTALEQNGVFRRCAGLLFGQFTDCGPREELAPLFRRIAADAGGPVLMNFPFGHTFPLATLDFHRGMSVRAGRVFVTA